jgi:hypothetical protein
MLLVRHVNVESRGVCVSCKAASCAKEAWFLEKFVNSAETLTESVALPIKVAIVPERV